MMPRKVRGSQKFDGSVGQGDCVSPDLAARRIDAIGTLYAILNALVASESAIAWTNGPSKINKLFTRFCWNACFETQQATRSHAGLVFTHRLR